MFLKNIKSLILKILSNIFQFLIVGIRPLLGAKAQCKYTFSCTEYAVYCLNNEPFFKALKNITVRVFKCFIGAF